MYKIIVMGLTGHGLTQRQKDILADCALIVGGKRLLDLAVDIKVATTNIIPLAAAMTEMKEALNKGNVGVLASGDPLFFGIGKKLLAHFGPEKVEIQAAISAMQEASARFKLVWDDAHLISLHGRSSDYIPSLLLAHPKTFVFTDHRYTPDALAREIIAYLELIGADSLRKDCQILVAEDLGSENESIFKGNLDETCARKFTDLNVFCLLRPVMKKTGRMGLTETDLAHSRGLITKDEVRAVTLHSLRLPQAGVFWDVGAGSGSISIEAARLNPELTIFAIEQKEEELANIKANIRRYGCYNVVPVVGSAPDIMAELPDPQRVFIGGSGGKLAEIINAAAKRLPAGGWLVANGVLEKTVSEAPKLMIAAGLISQMSTINVTRTGQNKKPVIFNPITIIAGEKADNGDC